jgi:hypothetical protein
MTTNALALPASMVVSSNPLQAPAQARPVQPGTLLRDLAPVTASPLMLRVNGQWLLRADWWRPVLPGDVIEWHQIPMGGGNGGGTSRQILTIIAIIAISYFTAGAGLIGLQAGSATALAIGAVATVAATAIINALIPIQQPVLGTTQSPGSVYNVTTAANQARLSQPIPVIYGRMLTFPDYAGQPYAEYDSANNQFFYAVYCVSQGKVVPERLQIDNTSLDHYSDVNYEILPPGSLPTLALSNVVTSAGVIGQTMDSGRVIGGFAASGPGTLVAQIGIDVVLPRGLGLADNSGNIGPLAITWRSDARYVDDFGTPNGDWFTLQNEAVSRSTNTPQRLSYKYTLPSVGRVEVRIVRTDTKNTSNNALHEAAWTALRAYLSTPATLSPTATHMAIRIRASEQLSGTSQRRISGIWRRWVRTWSAGGGWTAEVETRNPMWARLDKLTNAVYGDGLPDARIDLQSHADLAAVYDQRQDHFDILFDSKVTSIDADRTICMAGRAVPFQRAGVCTVTRDQLQTLPVTAFTSRDMAPGSMSIGYALATEVTADGVIVEYFHYKNWDWREVLCRAPGVATPVRAVRQRILGISGPKQAEREGLYMAAQNVYRRKFPTFTTELIGLLPAYGSAVMFTPALPGWGQAGDVAFWNATTLVMGVTEPAAFTPGAQHFISIRRDDGSVTAPIAVTPGPTEYDLQMASAPLLADGATPMPLILDDAGRERPKYVFGASGQHRIMVRLLGISKKGRGKDGAQSIELKTVAEDVRVHQADIALLPGPGEVQDSIATVSAGAATSFTTIIDINARNSSSSSASGIRLGGMSADWILRLELPTGQTWAAWSPWSSDNSQEVPSPPNAWGTAFSVTNTDGSTATFGANGIASSAEAARAGFSSVTITGYTSYTFWISDSNPGDNRGGLSIRVTKL